jgi:lipopolysaccharide export system protein LptA
MRFSRLLLVSAAGILLRAPVLGQSAAPQNTVITCAGLAEMVSADKETTITLRDQVVVTGTNMKLTCDYLQVVVLRTGNPADTVGRLDKFRSMLATGNVHLVQGEREAACGRAEILPEDDTIVLTETPVIVMHNPDFRGAGRKITMHRGKRQVEIDEPVLTAPPVKDLGFDKEKKPDAPAPAETPKQP